ncbi:uncharacterized protein LOC100276718 [Zea mays]|uniref:Epidermal patterning factor-like protein n=1 Tax=Zea mays TaxID=4577 RepID=B6TGW5_MAIZE|nr:uncharacterized protein LOC100276718 [Zea mays]ACG36348.1 hypothetical protein [Zea mays]AQK94460.1 EPIDERMAL PATTERNING FACTOR-like protein 6 [Zea mays]|eukprot:NP_001143912.1 uncharacterized protein LOC100276718 [Zea mays]
MGRPRWWAKRWKRSSGSARTLGVAAVVALVVPLCFVASSSRLPGTLGGGALASGTMAAAAGAHHPGDQAAATHGLQELFYIARRRRRRLAGGGLGSHPPRCASKCGRCDPCYPVSVPLPVPRGVLDLVTPESEYYPEAWRCRCRDQLYMP